MTKPIETMATLQHVARSVVLATPSFSHSVCLEYMKSALETCGLLMQSGISPRYSTRGGDQFIAKVRNKLVWQFMTDHPEADSIFFIDDDIGWPAQKVLEFIQRPEPILCGIYPKRQDDLDWPCALWSENGELCERDGLVRLVSGPAGFMRIRREVFEVMLAQRGDGGQVPWFNDMEKGGEVKTWPGLFTAGVGPDGWYWGEDYAFCRNAGACGFEIWADPDIHFTHRGPKVFEGSMAGSLEAFRERAKVAFEASKSEEAA
jgi:hypothetical protein